MTSNVKTVELATVIFRQDYHNSLDPFSEIPEQANGKACIIGETSRMVKDMLKQIECLKRENEALLFESQYVRLLFAHRCLTTSS